LHLPFTFTHLSANFATVGVGGSGSGRAGRRRQEEASEPHGTMVNRRRFILGLSIEIT
jgi:hypothetical protein